MRSDGNSSRNRKAMMLVVVLIEKSSRCLGKRAKDEHKNE